MRKEPCPEQRRLAPRKRRMLEVLETLLKKAKAAGADSADAILTDSGAVSVSHRMGKLESVVRSEESEVGLRVFVGKRQAIVSSSDKSLAALEEAASRAVAMAKASPEDPYAGIAASEEIARDFPDLDLHDATDISVEKMSALAAAAEEAALTVKGITNSDGAEFNAGKSTAYYAASNGFARGYPSSSFSLSVSVVAGKDMAMETDYDFDAAAFLSDIKSPALIGRNAGERAVRALNPKKGRTCRVPVVFDSRVAGGMIGSLAGAISGPAVARGTTLLKNKMGEQVFAKGLVVTDNPFLKRGMRSHPFDAEGIAPQRRNIIEDGVLTGWLLDLASARQLKLQTTGNAVRGTGSPPSPRPANFYLHAGQQTPEQMVAEIDEGFFVTEMMGSGANIVTGDCSRGARGFWIERGRISYPVSEMTIAGNLKDMWMNMMPANDLEFRYGIDAPTLRVDGMTVAGA